jgi:DNA-binding CsgD family transcriptional regulator
LQQRWGLTPREADIVVRVNQGERNRRIAEELGVNEQTVKNHIAAVYKKLGVSSRVELLNLLDKR